MRFSFWLNPWDPFADLVATARHAEATGWDGIYLADHFMPNDGSGVPAETPTVECGAALAALAALIPRVRIGTLVFGNTYRHPAVLANVAATVDQVCEGRLTLGVGAGWQENEHRQYGIDLPPVRERLDRFEEAVQVVRGLLEQPRTTFEGTYYRLTDAVCEPKPVQRPLPILIGGGGERRMLGIVARYAHVWNAWGTPDVFEHKTAVLDRHCAEVGRDPGAILRTAQAMVRIGDTDTPSGRKPALAGPPAKLVDELGRYAAAGLDEFIVPGWSFGTGTGLLRQMDTFIETVAAPLR